MINIKSLQQRLNKGTYLGEVTDLRQFDGILASVTTYRQDKPINIMHSHEQTHVSFILKGGHVEKRRKTEQELFPGDILFYHSEEPHLYTPKAFPASSINLEVEDSFFRRLEITEADMHCGIQGNIHAPFVMLHILREMRRSDAVSGTAIPCLLLELLNKALPPGAGHLPRWALTLKELLHDQWDTCFSLDQLSQHSGVHPITISKHFRSLFSCTLGEYMRRIKVHQAVRLIHNSSYSLTEIAYVCGFSDQSHFIRTFKEYTGFLPKSYQKM